MPRALLLALLVGPVFSSIIDHQNYYYSRQPALFRLLIKHGLWPKNETIEYEKPEVDRDAPSPFIYGGDTASIDTYPYQLSLRHEGTHICGASVISSRWALSAAHCLDDATYPAGITFRGGTPHRLAGGYIFNADEYYLHPKFDRQTLDYDVAVIHVKESFFIDRIEAIALADTNTVYPIPSTATVIGWGTAEGGYTPLILQSLQVYLQQRSLCAASWIDQITERMFCAGGGEVGKDVCNGDSGGPLILNGYQIGIVSWGSNTCAINLPGVYTALTNDEVRAFIKVYASV
ncbi:trypsin 3A1-like [Anopheles bellator]|uniref:trypsin 3A1-like n=1 Tax=Anopheles bellator TaxID=139047 RepID=UPI00264985D8|nr:trypsin 3A1-like [Anopheles bellator]